MVEKVDSPIPGVENRTMPPEGRGSGKSRHRYRPYYGKRKNVGAYQQPFSGVGMEFEPLGAAPVDTGFVLHETGYWLNCGAWNFPSVYSPFWRIYYDYEARHQVRFGDKLTALRPDRVVVIPDHQRFDCIGDEPVAKLWFSFSCLRSADPGQPMPIVIPVNDVIAAFAEELPRLFRSHRPDRRERVFQLSLSFVLYVLSQPQICWQDRMPEHLARVLTMIDENPAGQWSTACLAEQAGMSADGFARCFRRWLHVTPARYVHQVRVREACRTLADSDNTIKQIAVSVGFANRHHFSRVFRALTGTTPARYRRNHGRVSAGDGLD